MHETRCDMRLQPRASRMGKTGIYCDKYRQGDLVWSWNRFHWQFFEFILR